MEIITDLHMHSKYSRATSPKMNVEDLSHHAKIKGINILGSGDFTHPVWIEELKSKLHDNQNGIYEYDDMKFMLTGEISLIYTQEKGRRIHVVMLAPNFEVVDQINEYLESKGRRDYDGRPIFKIPCPELTERLMSISKDIEIIPAHCWTPWFSLFGSMSGFDTVEECFQDQTKHIHALETGLSSTPEMNWRLSQLDDYSLVSFSDSHSPYSYRLGREVTIFDLKQVNYQNIINALRKKKVSSTIEVDPSYGKYHFDGHRACGVCLTPIESNKLNKMCPKCKRKLTIGVLNRVEELADRPEGFLPKNAAPFKSLLPLSELIAMVKETSVATKKVLEIHSALTQNHSEFDILLNTSKEELEKITEPSVVSSIIANRNQKIKIEPGYDGVYGKPILEKKKGLEAFI